MSATVARRHQAAVAEIMTLLSIAIAVLLLAGPAIADGPARQGVRTWTFEVMDPARPGRVIGVMARGPATPEGTCPVLVFGHATLTPVTHYDHLTVSLAASGWLVLLPDTEGGMPADQAELAADMLLLADLARQRSAQLPPDLPPTDHRWALAGHSLGGGAAVLAAAAAAASPPQALVLLAPQERQRPSAIARAREVTSPTLLVSGDHDCLTPPPVHHWPLHEALAATPRVLATLLGGGHCAFADPGEPCHGGEQSCGHHLTYAQQQELTMRLTAPWLAWHVDGVQVARREFLAALADPQYAVDLVDEVTVAAPTMTSPRLSLLGGEPDGGARWRFQHDGAGPPARASLHDMRGRRIADLAATARGDAWDLRWDGRDSRGRSAPSGLYLLRVEAPGVVLTSRFTRLD